MTQQPVPRPTPAGSPPGARTFLLVAALASAVLLWACYFPLAWGWFAWVALVPLLCLVRTTVRPWFVYLCAWASGLAFFWPVLQWMRVADYRMYATWAMLATYCSLYVPVAVFLLRRLDSRTGLPLCLTLPAVWVALEFVRSFLMTGFAWYYLGHTQHAFLPVIQVSDLGGVYAVSFLVAAVNAVIFEWLYLLAGFRRLFALRHPAPAAVPGLTRNRWLQTAVVIALLAGALGYGGWRMGQDTLRPGPRIALLQGNLDQRLRNSAASSEDAAHKIIVHYAELCRAAATQDPRPDLIVWPETSFPAYWIETSPAILYKDVPPWWAERHNQARDYCREVAAECCQASVLLGLNTLELVDPHKNPIRYNTALLVQGDGKTGGRYDKIHRVPFGEYVPLRDWLPLMQRFAPYDFDYSIRKGTHLSRLQLLDKYRFGVLICFEDTDPELARQYGRETEDGPPADFLVNISNDGWFDGTSEHEEHLALCRFRAVEARRSVARAVNMGVSALIDSNGRVLQPFQSMYRRQIPLWEVPAGDGLVPELETQDWWQFKKVPGVLSATVPIDSRTSLYALWGDWFAYGCCGVLALGLLMGVVRRPTVRFA